MVTIFKVAPEHYVLFDYIVKTESLAFNETSLTKWTLESYVRFGFVYCVMVDEEVVGVAIYMCTNRGDNSAYLVSMAIEPFHQRKGFGKKLLNYSIRDLADSMIDRICLHVDGENTKAINLYIDKLGFVFAGYHRNEYGKAMDRVFLELDIERRNERSENKNANFSSEKSLSQIQRTKKASRYLRQKYYSLTAPEKEQREKPLFGKIADGMPTESLGPFPEFILPTHPCSNSIRGYCAPCFFSKHPNSILDEDEIFSSLIIQTQYIVDNFDEIVLKFQMRGSNSNLPYYDATICYACNGSFFSDSETKIEHRIQALAMLDDEAKRRSVKLLTYIETCSADFLSQYKSGGLGKLITYLRAINAVVLFGFESVSYYTRNVLYNKNLDLSDFEKAISVCKELGLGYGAFVYTGYHSMTEQEIINDVLKTLFYLRKKEAVPVLMFPNLQPFTIYHLSYLEKAYSLYDPRTALLLFEALVGLFDDLDVHSDKWLTGDLFGGPPAPPVNVFSNPRKISCEVCSEKIRKAMMYMKKHMDYAGFKVLLSGIEKCECKTRYDSYLASKSDDDLYSRVDKYLDIVDSKLEKYVSNEFDER